jgi:hypothetical protein
VPDSIGCRSLTTDDKGDFYAACQNGVVRIERGSLTRLTSTEFQDVHVNSSAGGLFIGEVPPTNAIRLYRQASGDEFYRLPEKFPVLAAPANGKWIVTANEEGSVVFWPLTNDLVPRTITYRGDVADLTFSHDEKWLAVVESDGGVHIFNPASGTEVKSIELHTELVRPMFSPDDSVLTLLGSNEVHLLQTSDWTPIKHEVKAQSGELSFAFTADSRMLLVVETGTVRRFQLRPSWNVLPPIPVSRRESVFLSNDRKWIGQMPPPVGDVIPERFRFWNVESGVAVSWDAIPPALGLPSEPGEDKDDQPNSIPNWIRLYPRDPATDAQVSGDAFGGDWYLEGDTNLRIKEMASMRLVADLGVGSSWAFSHKGSWIGIADNTAKELRIWPWSLEGLLDRACELLPRNLTIDEWKRFDLPKLGLDSPRATCKNLPSP